MDKRLRAELASRSIDLLWSPTSPELEAEFLPVKVSLLKELNNYRLLLIRPETQAQFSRVKTLNDLRQFKRPDLLLALAKRLPEFKFHMIGGPQPGFSELFETIRSEALHIPNLTFHGAVPYQQMDEKYAGARVFVNTSDSEGFPNSYLQAWIRGTPVVAFFDPDAVIAREGLGRSVSNLEQMASAVVELVEDQRLWTESSQRCKAYMAVAHAESRIVRPYLDMFEKLN